MFLKSELSRIGKMFMFVVLDNNYYNIGNAGKKSENFLWFVGEEFPLRKSMPLELLEKRYFEKAKKEIEKFKTEYAKEQKIDMETIAEEIEKNDFLRFYLFSIQSYYAEDVSKKFGLKDPVRPQSKDNGKSSPILVDILSQYNGNIGVVNRRIFPLKEIREKLDPCAVIDGKMYGFMESQMSLDEFENIFQATLESRLKDEVFEESSYLKKQEQEISSAESALSRTLGNCRKNRFSYEYGPVGFDTEINYIYWLPVSKNGKPNEKKAIGTPLTKTNGKIKVTNPVARIMLTRNNKDEPFNIGEVPCIYIDAPSAENIVGVINYLKECVDTKF